MDGIEYGEWFGPNKSDKDRNKVKQGAAHQAYNAISLEQKEKRERYQSLGHY